MAPTPQVRPAGDADRQTLLRFHKALYEAHRERVVAPEDLPLVDYRGYEKILADDLDALLRDRNACVLIAEVDGQAVGYITGRISTEPRRVLPKRGIVEDWYVAEASRGAGIGAHLLDELQKRFIEAGCQLIESATWSGNKRARQAHTSLGFREIRVIYRKKL